MQYGTIFGDVDFFACEHLIAPAFNIGFARQLKQQRQGFIGNAVFGVIQQQIFKFYTVFIEAFCVGGEQVAHVQRHNSFLMRAKFFPNRVASK